MTPELKALILIPAGSLRVDNPQAPTIVTDWPATFILVAVLSTIAAGAIGWRKA